MPTLRVTSGPSAGRTADVDRVVVIGRDAAVIVPILLLSEDSTESHPFTGQLTTALLSQEGNTVNAGGTMSRFAIGDGAVVVTLVAAGDLAAGNPVDISGTVVFYLEGGRIDSRFTGQAIPQPDRTTNLVGTATIDGGTGLFGDATGSFSFRSGQEPENPTIGHPMIEGTIDY
jgi:hypothetical protein